MSAEEVQETSFQDQKQAQEEQVPREIEKPEATSEEELIKKFPEEKKALPLKNLLIVFLIIAAGIGTGYLLSARGTRIGRLKSTESISQEGLKAGDVFGNPDKETFRDQAEGVLIKGGIDGEGSHHLLRPGGESQNVYLTSSVVDLEQFVDHKVRVWGETFAAQKAGWLMDVGRVEVVELNAQKPSEVE